MKKTIRDYNLNNKKVLIRCDFNVPIIDNKIVDDNRIVQSLETINYAIKNNAKVVLFSHLGKVVKEEDKKTKSLKVVSERLSKLLNKEVIFVSKTEGKELEKAIENMNSGDVLLVENTRFEDLNDKRESKNDESLAKYWASLGDIFINDAFATAHRNHASNVGIASNIPSGIGFLIEKEIAMLDDLNNPSRPFVVVLGGAKIADKIEFVESLSQKADKILIGGGMLYTFLSAKGISVGKSIIDIESIPFAKKMLDKFGDKIVLAIDNKVTKIFDNESSFEIKSCNDIANDDIGLDIGPKTIELFSNELKNAKTIFWNGTLGYSEFSKYQEGTIKILDYISSLNAVTILGGGDTAAAAKLFGYVDKLTYVSTGGGATLEYISGKKMPGIEIINNK